MLIARSLHQQQLLAVICPARGIRPRSVEVRFQDPFLGARQANRTTLTGTWTIGLYTNVPRAAPIGQSWTLADTYIGPSFLSGFEHEAIPDPTGGRVCVFVTTLFLYRQSLTLAQKLCRSDYGPKPEPYVCSG